jgi:hypothetical protein
MAELTPAEALAYLEGRLQVTIDDGLFEVADALAVLAAAVEDAERLRKIEQHLFSGKDFASTLDAARTPAPGERT